jgi:hypothetical protein
MSAVPRGAVAVGLAVLGLVCCAKEPDPIGRDVQSIKDRSVPPGGRLIPSYGPGRGGQVFRASWEIEADIAWSAYAAWLVAQLPEFRVRADDGEALSLSRPLEGDVYILTLRRKPAEKGLLVEATFESRPF